MRWVLHIDMDAFFASVEQLCRPTLRNRPVLVGGTTGRGVVAGASYEARALGAHSAMPMHQAKKLVGFSGITVTPRHGVYAVASQRVFDIVRAKAGLVEQVSIDEGFLEPKELQGASVQEVEQWAQDLRREIFEHTGLPSSIGAGRGKQIAKISSGLAKPQGICVIPQEQEAKIIAPLPVRKLWGIGPVAEGKLHTYGIKTIAEFAALSRNEVEKLLGKTVGINLWMVAGGIDHAPVVPRSDTKSVGAEYTFSHDLIHHSDMIDALNQALREAFSRLLDDGRGARTITVKIKTHDFRIFTRSHTRAEPTMSENLFVSIAHSLLPHPETIGPIRLVGVSFSNLEYVQQEILFPELDAGMHTSAQSYYDTEEPSEDDSNTEELTSWRTTEDVWHPDYGHGWVQGSGHGVVTVRFETRTTRKSFSRTFPIDTPMLQPSDPLKSLDWDDYLTHGDPTTAP